MHSYFKKGLILAAFVGIFGAGSGIHAKAAELPVQTGNPAVNADGLLRQVQKTEDQASSIIIEETEKNGEFVVREQNGNTKIQALLIFLLIIFMSEAPHLMTVTGPESFIREMQ